MHEELFEKYPVPKAVMTLAIPTILGMLVTVIYNMADTFFVGQTGDPNQVAAVSLTMPVFLLLMAFGNIFGIGGGTYISRLLGVKDYEKAKNVSSFSYLACIGVGILSGTVFLIFMKPILSLAGASTNTYGFSKDYLIIIAIGAPFVCLQHAMGQIIRAEGAAKEAMIGMMIGTVLNIVLDPVMILSMKMGVVGAAIATILGNMSSVFYYIYYITKRKTALSISLSKFKASKEIIGNITAIGIPASINNILMSASNMLLNNFAAGYGDTVIAALGIASRIVIFPGMLMIGLAQGIQPFIGYNFAARNYKRMNHSIKFSTVISVIGGLIFAVLFFLGAEISIRGFIDNAEVVELGSRFFRIMTATIPILGIQFILMNTLQALGKAKPSLFLSLCRQGIAFVPALIIGNMLFKLDGIVWAQPVADLFTVILSGFLYFRIWRSLKDQKLIRAA